MRDCCETGREGPLPPQRPIKIIYEIISAFSLRHLHVSTVPMTVVPLGVAAGSHGLLHQETEQNLNDHIAPYWPGLASH